VIRFMHETNDATFIGQLVAAFYIFSRFRNPLCLLFDQKSRSLKPCHLTLEVSLLRDQFIQSEQEMGRIHLVRGQLAGLALQSFFHDVNVLLLLIYNFLERFVGSL